MPQDRMRRRKHSRSLSPVHKHRRSWQHSSGPPLRQRSPSPLRGKKDFRSPGKFDGRKNFGGPLRRSRSPRFHKRPRPRSPIIGRGPTPPFERQRFSPPMGRGGSGSKSHIKVERSGSRSRQRSLSPRPPLKAASDRVKRESKYEKMPSPGPGPSSKKKSRHSHSPPPLKRSRSRSPASSTLHKRNDPPASAQLNRGDSLPQRKVSASGKKKTARVTLHKRFTLEDQERFELEENVTIAILRNPNVEPSEDVTVKRVFDASLFKMVHKKSEGRKPIFDREEIKVWRHDENLADDPDFERRLVRVKSASVTSKPASDSLSRMSPDVIRKAFGLQVGGRSRSRSPHREPQIRLDPRPDPRYESKFREQMEKEEELGGKMRREEDRRGDMSRKGVDEKRGSKGDLRERDRRREEDRRGGRGKGETYDLRQALERRRSDREEGSFRIEIRRDDGDPGAELFYRDDQRGRGLSPSMENRRFIQDGGPGRSVVMQQEKDERRYEGSPMRDRRRSWDNDRRMDRGRGRGGRGRGRRREWSPDRGITSGGMREEDTRNVRDRERSLERRPRYSMSPVNNRGWKGGFRPRGRGRGRDFGAFGMDIASPTQIDDSFKYSQVSAVALTSFAKKHDDRDVSPKPFRGRGGRSRFRQRSFGSRNFRATNRGGGRGGRGFRGGYRSRGFGSSTDRRSLERLRDLSLEREWKHDLYDSIQTEEEQPHSTTVGT